MMDIVSILIDAGANLNICCNEGQYPITIAALEGHHRVVKKLVESGACINVTNEHGNTSLMNAIARKHILVVRALLDAGMNLDQQNQDGHTALHFATGNKQYEITDMLLLAGAKQDNKNNDGLNPLDISIINDDIRMVEKLLKSAKIVSKDPSNENFPPVYCAALAGKEEMIEMLLAAHCDIFSKSHVFDPISAAVKKGYVKIIEMLLAMRDSYLIEEQCKYDAMPSVKDFTCMHTAAIEGREDVVKLLIAFGMQKNALNMYDMAPTDCARSNNHHHIVDLLSDDAFPTEEDKSLLQQRLAGIRTRIQEVRDAYGFE